MSVESEQLHQVAEWAQRYGVLWHHCGNTRLCVGDPGLPDVVMAGPGGLLFGECKSNAMSVTPDQRTWQWMLRATGRTDVGVWLPSSFREGIVETQIRLISQRRDQFGEPI
jgi:hypothetical protein